MAAAGTGPYRTAPYPAGGDRGPLCRRKGGYTFCFFGGRNCLWPDRFFAWDSGFFRNTRCVSRGKRRTCLRLSIFTRGSRKRGRFLFYHHHLAALSRVAGRALVSVLGVSFRFRVFDQFYFWFLGVV
jgi:hypothetical protein